MMLNSPQQVTCDLDTLIYSGISKSEFISSGLTQLRGHEKAYVFRYIENDETKESFCSNLINAYPILSRFRELELFDNILDDIGLVEREVVGIIIEGDNRTGKSRILDAYVTLAKARQLMVVKLVLHTSFVKKPYAVIYTILKMILQGDDHKTMHELESNAMKKLAKVIPVADICYLNKILRTRFKLTKQYIMDSDWDRHRKALNMFDKILSKKGAKYCLVLDNVQYMDYMSWQFLKQAIKNKNVVIAMSILGSKSLKDLSKLESEICKHKRLLRQTVGELERESLPALICQLLSVQGISVELYNFLMNAGVLHPGWYELFVTIMILHCGFTFAFLTPSEIAKHKLMFPDILMVTRFSADLLPEEVAPPFPWDKKERISICFTNEKFAIAESLKNYSIEALALEIYARLGPYEQDTVKCASVLGKVFVRSMLEMIIPNQQSLKTAMAIENLMRARIFECASLQRRSTKVGNLAVCSFKPRSTFSDMHHLLRCRCHLRYVPPAEKGLSRYAHCRFMEFKVSTFQHLVHQQFSDKEKKELHAEVVEIYKKDAKKCSACGGGSFLRIPGKEKSKTFINSISVVARNIPPCTNNKTIKPYSIKENNDSEQKRDEIRQHEITGISVMRTSFQAQGASTAESRKVDIIKHRKIRRQHLYRKIKIHPVTSENNNLRNKLNKFGHIDFRNCRCLSVINCIFMKLYLHIQHIDNNDKIINFMMEYAAALIDYGEPSYALRFLSVADERNEFVTYDDWKNPLLYGKKVKKSIILCLRGNAFMHLGNYPQAKTSYIDALSLYNRNFNIDATLLTHCRITCEKLRQNIRWAYTHSRINTHHAKYEKATIIKQNTASCLRLISRILIIDNERKAAKLASAQSIVFGFSNYDPNSFYDQCQLYLSIVKIYGQLGDFTFLNQVEKYILFATNQKNKWSNSEDVVIVARVYAAIFKVSLLQGRLERAVLFGTIALRIANFLHMVGLEYEILPALIQASIRLKRVCESIDLVQQLRDTSFEDVDKSALTWYYALCMDLMLDAGILVESYDTCASYARKMLAENSEASTHRDSDSIRRLLIGLWLWQLRKGDVKSTTFVKDLDFFVKNYEIDNYSQITTICKILECYLLLLTRSVNLKKSEQMETLLLSIADLMKILNEIVKYSSCIQPHFYLLRAYYYLLHARTVMTNTYLSKAERSAKSENNVLALAWIHQNRNTWKAVSYNNMASYWEENIGYRNRIVWQDVDMFDISDWSNILYSLPIPDSYI